MQSLQEFGWFLATEGSTGREWWGLLVVALGILGWLWGKRLGRRRLPMSISSLLLATLITGQLTGCGAEGGAAGGAPKGTRPGEITPENTSYRIVMHEPLGNVLGEVDSEGNRLASARVEPYGARKVDPALQTSRVHAGTPYDAGVGLDQMGQRSYAPDLGHFVSGDPVAISEPERHITPEFGAAHPYAYAGHRPTGAVDRNGESPVLAGAAAGAAVEAALEALRQYQEHGKIVDGGRIAAAAAAGAISGTLMVLNPAAGVGALMAAGGFSNVAGGVAERLLNSEGQSAGTVHEVAVDFGLGAATGGLTRIAGPLIQKLRPPQVRPLTLGGGADAVASARAAQGSGRYPGIDDWQATTLQPGQRLVQLAPGNSNYYTTVDALNAAQGSRSALSRSLQVEADDLRGFRQGATVFEVGGQTPGAISIVQANSQHGPGGAVQFYLPDASNLMPLVSIPLGR